MHANCHSLTEAYVTMQSIVLQLLHCSESGPDILKVDFFSMFLCFSIFYVHFTLFVPEKKGGNVFCKQRKNSKEVIQTARTQFRHPASSVHHHYNYRYTFFSIFRITVIMISDRTGKNLCGTVIQQIQLRGQPFHYITSEILS